MASSNSVRVRTGEGYGWGSSTTLAAMRRRLLFATAAALAAVGCSSGGTEESAATSSLAATESAAAVPAALDFDAPLVGGGRFDARQQVGRPLALWFWAPY